MSYQKALLFTVTNYGLFTHQEVQKTKHTYEKELCIFLPIDVPC